ncbi:MAG: hypothetical protein F6K48_17475 [Okeania sp. SIO3H1]|nr:hypothetical protein [Okeania sp. SIO3H1]
MRRGERHTITKLYQNFWYCATLIPSRHASFFQASQNDYNVIISSSLYCDRPSKHDFALNKKSCVGANTTQ